MTHLYSTVGGWCAPVCLFSQKDNYTENCCGVPVSSECDQTNYAEPRAPWDLRVPERPGKGCPHLRSPAALASADRGSTLPQTACDAAWLPWPRWLLPRHLRKKAGSAAVFENQELKLKHGQY